jgi:Holliday junction resolvase RusA-like endonuclease
MMEHANGFTFVIEGRCPTKGSTKSFIDPKSGRVITKADNAKLSRWTRDAKSLIRACRPAMIHKPDGVNLSVRFEFLKPKSVDRALPTVRPDIDKTLRAVLDVLTGLCYADDSQVVYVATAKVYGASERVIVEVERAA